MEKEYKFEENSNILSEPTIEYNIRERYLPPLTEEELAEAITGDELMLQGICWSKLLTA